MPRVAAVTFLSLFVAACARFEPVAERFGENTRAIHVARLAVGDEHAWSSPLYDDSAWPLTRLWEGLPARTTFWVRETVETRAAEEPLGIYVGSLTSIEVFWDGRKIGSAGTFGPDGRAGEPGPIDNLFAVTASPGRHLLAIRFAPSDQADRLPWFSGIAIGPYRQMARSRLLSQLVPLAGVGVFLVVAIYAAALWTATGRRSAMLMLSLLCLAAAVLVILETWRWVIGYTYDWHGPRLIAIAVATFAVALFLPLFFLLDLGMRRAPVWAGLIAAALIGAQLKGATYDERCLLMLWVSVLSSAAVITFAARRRKWEVVPAAIGIAFLLVAIATGGYAFTDRFFFPAFVAFVAFLLISLAWDTRRQRRLHQETALRAARLEIELLKKTIEPHFLMNSLTAMMEWLEQSPAEGVRFLEALAEELRILNEISGFQVIPMERELALCHSHLAIMSCRTGVRFVLDHQGVDPAAVIPPAVFQTLLENAITHNPYRDQEVVFHMRERRAATHRTYVLQTPITARAVAGGGDGVGLRYVRARLEEAFPSRWRLESSVSGGMWTTTIEVG